MCLHLEFERFVSKLEMMWNMPFSLWWHVLLSVMCDYISSMVYS